MVCNKFLTLRFGCEQGEVLGFQAKNVFSCVQLGVFAHDDNGDKEEHWWRCDGVYDFEVFMLFSFIWDVDDVVDIIRR